MSSKRKTFGATLREKRLAKGYSLRKFAGLIKVSPTYLSQVEQDVADPPTAERARKIAELLGENPDEMIALAGRLPEDIPDLIRNQPQELPDLLRAAHGLTAEDLHRLKEQALKMKGKERQ